MTANKKEIRLAILSDFNYKSFYPLIKNLTKEEWDELIIDIVKDEKISEKQKVQIIKLRKYVLNRMFEFTDEQCFKIIKIDKLLRKLVKKLYYQNSDILSVICKQKSLFVDFRHCDFETKIIMDSSFISESKALYYLLEWCNTKKFQYQPCAYDYTMDFSLNWNIELFHHPNLLKYEPWIGYSSHKLFCDGDILSLFDMIELKEEYFDFQIHIEGVFEPWEEEDRKECEKRYKEYRNKEQIALTKKYGKLSREGRLNEIS